jgi:ABC-2 type transport system ATP-binding protein
LLSWNDQSFEQLPARHKNSQEHHLAVIETHSLTRRYGRRRGIEAVTFSVPEGSLFGFLGPNGAGKTTAIRVLLGLLRPTAGSARIFGFDCWRDSRRLKSEIGYLPGDLRLYSWMNGADAVRIFGHIRNRDLSGPARQLADVFDLDLKVKVRSMSRGMRQKLGLILALAHQPRLLILDEPTSSLDPLMQEQLRRHLRMLASTGHTVFFSSHTLSEVEQLCDRVAIVREGTLVADATLAELQSKVGHVITIRWKDESAAAGVEPPACLDLLQREPPCWTGTLTGPIQDLTQWLSAQPIDDLTIARPDLEMLFRRYYEQNRAQ